MIKLVVWDRLLTTNYSTLKKSANECAIVVAITLRRATLSSQILLLYNDIIN